MHGQDLFFLEMLHNCKTLIKRKLIYWYVRLCMLLLYFNPIFPYLERHDCSFVQSTCRRNFRAIPFLGHTAKTKARRSCQRDATCPLPGKLDTIRLHKSSACKLQHEIRPLRQLSSTTFTAKRINLRSRRWERICREISTVKEEMWENDTQFFAQAPHQWHQHHSSTPLHSWVTSCRSCGSCKNKGGHRHLRNDWGLIGVERTDCAWVEMSSQRTPKFQQFGHFRVSRKQGIIWGRMGKCRLNSSRATIHSARGWLKPWSCRLLTSA